MKVFLIGATGATGFEVLKRLVKDHHQIQVLVRDPKKLLLDQMEESEQSRITVVKGSVMDRQKMMEQVQGSELVISALGTGTKNSYTEVYSEGGRNILNVMRSNGIKRLITVTAGLIDLSDPSTDNFFLNRIIRPNFNKVYYDQTRWETILDETQDIEWMCVRPTLLTNKGYTGQYRLKERHCPSGGRKISRADLADFIVKQMEAASFTYKKPVIAY